MRITSRRCRGRKTDVKDAEWIAALLKHGLLKPSFIPERSQRELRELVRYRQSLIQERSREANRIQKVLEGANIKLGSVASDVLGASGRMMLTALAEGEEDPCVLADMAKGRLRDKLKVLEEALEGVMGSHQRLILGTQLRHLSYLDAEVERLDAEVERRVGPHDDVLEAVDTIPGVGRRTAETIVAEVGTDMDRFTTPGHLASWAGVSPGNNRSADKSKRSPVKKGNASLQSVWWKQPGPPPGPRPIWEPSTAAWLAASEPTGPPWPLHTPSPSSSTPSSGPKSPLWTSATITSRSGTGMPSRARPFANSNGWAIKSHFRLSEPSIFIAMTIWGPQESTHED